MHSDAKTVPAYLKELPADRRVALSRLRKLIKKAAPDAKEHMQSGMPCFVVAGCPIIAMAAQKRYMALYVCAWNAMKKYRNKLGTTNCGKGCVRFTRLDDLSLDVVEELLAAAAHAARQAQ